MDEIKKIKKCFCEFIEDVLVKGNTQASNHLAEDVMSIGMGNQGIVSCKEALYKIQNHTKKNEIISSKTTVTYRHMQIRYFGDPYASINVVLSVCTTLNDKSQTSHIG